MPGHVVYIVAKLLDPLLTTHPVYGRVVYNVSMKWANCKQWVQLYGRNVYNIARGVVNITAKFLALWEDLLWAVMA